MKLVKPNLFLSIYFQLKQKMRILHLRTCGEKKLQNESNNKDR